MKPKTSKTSEVKLLHPDPDVHNMLVVDLIGRIFVEVYLKLHKAYLIEQERKRFEDEQNVDRFHD